MCTGSRLLGTWGVLALHPTEAPPTELHPTVPRAAGPQPTNGHVAPRGRKGPGAGEDSGGWNATAPLVVNVSLSSEGKIMSLRASWVQ
jgi:hypothetical protein